MNIDEFTYIQFIPVFSDEFPVHLPVLASLLIDLTQINSKLEGLQLDTRTQSLQIEVERAKQQRMGARLKRKKEN